MKRFVICSALLVFSTVHGAAVAADSAGSLDAEIQSVDLEIKAAQDDSAQYTGGLLKTLIDLRIATLEQTRAMLDQQRHAKNHSIALRYTISGKAYVPPADAKRQVQDLEKELADQREKTKAAQADADQYSGGLVQSMALMTVATSKQTEAMLEQRRAALKFGFPLFLGSNSSGDSADNPSKAAASPTATPEDQGL